MLEKYYRNIINSLLASFKLSNAEPQFEDDYHYGNIPFKDKKFILFYFYDNFKYIRILLCTRKLGYI